MKIQRNDRLDPPYVYALRKFNRQGSGIVQEALDNSPHQPFRKELAKQKEAYDPSKDNEEDHPAAQDIRQEFDD